MSDVKIKKSVLQSIIKKSLRESPRNDVSRRLTVGPDDKHLPSSLPLSPSDRMSTQLEVERPPVEDPEYVPSNSKELGLALQALAEMIPSDQVEQAYNEFQSVIEKLENEATAEKDVQIESLRRSNARLKARLREAEGMDDDDDDLSSEDEAELAAIEREEATGTDALYFKYERVLEKYGVGRSNFDRIMWATRDGRVSTSDIEDFLQLLGDLQNDPALVDRVGSRLRNPNARGLESFISKFKDDYEDQVTRDAAVAADKATPRFEYQTAAKPLGYAAASGARQWMINMMANRAIMGFATSKPDQRFILNSIREAFQDAFQLPANQDFLSALFDEEALPDLKEIVANDEECESLELFQNFGGVISYEACDEIGDLRFPDHNGKKGRLIRDAFLSEFGNDRITNREQRVLEQMAIRGEFKDIVMDVLDKSEANGYRSTLSAAATLSSEDLDFKEFGSYEKPAGAGVKKASAVEKPSELHIADYLGKDDPMVGIIQSAERAARKLSRK
jgi:hypothetical protein